MIRYTPDDVPTLRQAPLLLAALALRFEHPATGEQANMLPRYPPSPPRFSTRGPRPSSGWVSNYARRRYTCYGYATYLLWLHLLWLY